MISAARCQQLRTERETDVDGGYWLPFGKDITVDVFGLCSEMFTKKQHYNDQDFLELERNHGDMMNVLRYRLFKGSSLLMETLLCDIGYILLMKAISFVWAATCIKFRIKSEPSCVKRTCCVISLGYQ